MIDDKDLIELGRLILELKEGVISQNDLERLDRWLAESEEAFEFYRELMKNSVVLKRKIDMYQTGDSKSTIQELIRYLSKYEISAPRIEIFGQSASEQDLINKAKKIKMALYAVIFSAAALIFIAIGIHLTPNEDNNAAKLTDSIDSQWSGNYFFTRGDMIIAGGESYRLERGIIELSFNSGSIVTIEAPAEFQIVSDEILDMSYGKAYAKVPNSGIGFSIYTDNARIIDLGTEFGVMAGKDGDSIVQVVKGRTMLIAGNKLNKVSLELGKNTARKIASETGTVEDTAYDEHLFVRTIDSSSKVIWHGENRINLVNLFEGGNGFNFGYKEVGINPMTGEMSSRGFIGNRKSPEYKYIPINNNRYIDGVFVPMGGETIKQVVTSADDIFDNCPETNGVFWQDISNNPQTSPSVKQGADGGYDQVTLDGVTYGITGHPGLMMHSNTGITFDLDSIRKLKPEMQINSFSSVCGLSDSLKLSEYIEVAKVEMWVLIDGKVKERVQLDCGSQNKAILLVDINSNDRFISLVSTDAGNGVNGDWAFWGDPVLILK